MGERLSREERQAAFERAIPAHTKVELPDAEETLEERLRGLERSLTREESLELLEQDGGAVPCSRYGRNSADCAPVAWAVCSIHEKSNGEPIDVDGLEGAMSLVVNDSSSPLELILEHGEDEERETVADLIPDEFELILELGDAAMQRPADVAAALRDAAEKIERLSVLEVGDEGTIMDENGNTAGRFELS